MTTNIDEVTGAGRRRADLIAERQFGPIRAEGHVCHPDPSVTGLKARVAGFRASQNGAAA